MQPGLGPSGRFVELANQGQESVVRGMNVRGQLGNLVLERADLKMKISINQ